MFVSLFFGMEEKELVLPLELGMICNLQPGLSLLKVVVNSGYWGENIVMINFCHAFFFSLKNYFVVVGGREVLLIIGPGLP